MIIFYRLMAMLEGAPESKLMLKMMNEALIAWIEFEYQRTFHSEISAHHWINEISLVKGTICGIIRGMGKFEKLLEKMRQNPRDWRIDDLKVIADRMDVVYRQPGTSHVTFRFANGRKLTVPAHKPIKPIYVKQFINLVDEET